MKHTFSPLRPAAALLACVLLLPSLYGCRAKKPLPDEGEDPTEVLTIPEGNVPDAPRPGTAVQLATEQNSPLQFSHAPGFYDKALNLTLTAPEGWVIFYTENGTDPRTSSSRKVYSEPLQLFNTYDMAWGPAMRAWTRYAGNRARPSSNSLPGGYVIKACAEKDGETTAVYTASYFISPSYKKYGVKVISLSLPYAEMVGKDGFYSNYNPYDDYTATRPRGVGNVEIFSPDGVRLGNSNVELSVSGNGSSGAMMKSLRVYYKKSLNKDGNHTASADFDLFDGRALNDAGEVITSFSRLIFRNSGNDCGSSYFRDAFMQRACAGLNVDVMAASTAMLFVNGEFWGVYNVRERYSPEYVQAHYGVDKDNVCIIESDYSQVHTNTNVPYVVCNGEDGDADDFNKLVTFIKRNDLSKERNFKHVAAALDLDSFIDMWVARLYFNARDWPENNIKVWRNKNPDDPSGMDTKWHFTLLDMDMGLAYYDFTSHRDSIFGLAFNYNSVCSNIMMGLLDNPGFRDRFIARYYELVTEFFTADRLLPMFEEMYAERLPLMGLQAARWPGDGASVSSFKKTCDDARDFINNRKKYALRHFYAEFDIKEADAKRIYESLK